jgi:hypothetical protein
MWGPEARRGRGRAEGGGAGPGFGERWGWVAGVVAGLLWMGWCLELTGRSSAGYEARLLHFPTWDNIQLLASGGNESHALALDRLEGGDGSVQGMVLGIPRYTGSLGPVGG